MLWPNKIGTKLVWGENCVKFLKLSVWWINLYSENSQNKYFLWVLITCFFKVGIFILNLVLSIKPSNIICFSYSNVFWAYWCNCVCFCGSLKVLKSDTTAKTFLYLVKPLWTACIFETFVLFLQMIIYQFYNKHEAVQVRDMMEFN